MNKAFFSLRKILFNDLVLIFLLSLFFWILPYPPDLKFVLSFLIFIIFPGYLLARYILGFVLTPINLLPIAFCFGVALVVIPGLMAYKLAIGIDFLLYITLSISILLFIFSVLLKFKLHNRKMGLSYYFSFPFLGLSSIAIFFAVIMFMRGAYMGGLDGDAWLHLSIIGKRLFLPNISPANSQFFNAGIDNNNGYSIWLLLQALLSRFSNIDYPFIWYRLPFLLVPISVFSFFVYAREVLEDELSAFIALSLYIFFMGIYFYGQQITAFQVITYPYGVVPCIISPIAFYFIFKYLKEGKVINYLSLALLLFAIFATHLTSMFLFSVTFGSFLFFSIFVKQVRERYLARSAVVFLTASILMGFLQLLKGINLVVTTPSVIEGYKEFFTFLSPKCFFINPLAVLRKVGWFLTKGGFTFIPVYAVLLLPILFIFRKKNPVGATFLIAGISVPYFIMFNPLLVPALNKVIVYELIYRIYQTVPYFLIIGFAIGALFSQIKNDKGKKIVIPICFVVLFFSRFPDIRFSLEKFLDYRSYHKVVNEYPEKEAIDFINDNLAVSTVILTDKETGYIIPAFTGCYVVSVIPKCPPNVSDIYERIKATEIALSPDVPFYKRKQIFKKYNVDYVLIDKVRYKKAYLKYKYELKTEFDGEGYAVFKT